MESGQQDRQLIERSLAGDRAAFDALVGRYYDMMYTLAFRYSGRREDAEDIAHTAFIKMAEHMRGFKYDSSFKTWVYRIVINTAHDWRRKQDVRRPAQADPNMLAGNERPDQQAQAMDIVRMIDTLPPGERDVIILVSGQGLSHAEAADIIGCKESTVSWRLHEARKKLAALLDRDEGNG